MNFSLDGAERRERNHAFAPWSSYMTRKNDHVPSNLSRLTVAYPLRVKIYDDF